METMTCEPNVHLFAEIDQIDGEITRLLDKRMRLSKAVLTSGHWTDGNRRERFNAFNARMKRDTVSFPTMYLRQIFESIRHACRGI